MNIVFKYILHSKHPLQLALVFFAFSLVIEAFFGSVFYNDILSRRFQDRFLREQNELELRLDNFSELLKTRSFDDVYARKVKEFRDLATERNISMYVYFNDSLVMWSDNKIAESEILPVIAEDQKLLHLSNGWYYNISRQTGDYRIIGLLLIKSNYMLQNKFLQNSFNPIFTLPNNINVKTNTYKERYTILSNNGLPSFALVFEGKAGKNTINQFLLILLFSVSIVFLVLAYGKYSRQAGSNFRKLAYMLLFSLIFILLHQLALFFRFPGFLYELQIFKPLGVGTVFRNYSPGDLFFVAGILYLFAYYAYTSLSFQWATNMSSEKVKYISRLLALILLTTYFLFVNKLFEHLVFHTNLSFDSFLLTGFSFPVIIGIIAIALFFTVYVFFADYIYRDFFAQSELKNTIVITALSCSAVLIVFSLFNNEINWAAVVMLIISLSIIISMRKVWKKGYQYRYVVLLIIAFSLYSVYVFYRVSNIREEIEKKELAQSLATEHDMVAEYLISEKGNIIQLDSTIRRLTLQDGFDYPWLYKYIRKKYFSGYWERYDMQITVCKPADSLLLQPFEIYHHCYSFFSNLLQNSADELEGTDFYYLKNSNGRISYFTQVNYYSLNEKATLFIQLDSRLNVEDIGYPELLLDESLKLPQSREQYSYAKYYKDKLSYQSGSFLYNVSSLKYPGFSSNFHRFSFGGYDHLFYRANSDNLIVLSKPSIRFFDLMVSFSYLFIFYFLLLNTMLLVANPQWLYNIGQSGFKNKIRLSVIGVLLLSLIAVAGTTTYFITEQYSARHQENMRDKLQSVYLELENILASEKSLHYNWKSDEYNNLEELLRRLSNVFFTDINLYNARGYMIASSRPEIMDKGIAGYLMDTQAYFQLGRNNRAEFRHFEQLGNLKYSSIYTTLVNGQNEFLAYLNLPYFTRQSQIVKEISSMLYAIINFYVILILISVSIAVIISEKVIQPLRVVQERFSKIKLGMRGEKVEYRSNDEIGALVAEYNRMVDELEKSLELLARSEREMAWREMAKQVAHEIKNPLTPMKLSIQQLQRAWNDKHENLENYFNSVTQTLVEQIENLSAIATEFSNFAKMPKEKVEEIKLDHLIENVVKLFADSNVLIELNYNNTQNFTLWADKDQLSRVFINIITNAIQAIPDNKKGEINIEIKKVDDVIIVDVADNGNGIPENIIEKMFQPNFTTKSSGMGLGLAISKSIIDKLGGDISFITKQGQGSVFKVFIPVKLMAK